MKSGTDQSAKNRLHPHSKENKRIAGHGGMEIGRQEADDREMR
jgi:hypothetical protein